MEVLEVGAMNNEFSEDNVEMIDVFFEYNKSTNLFHFGFPKKEDEKGRVNMVIYSFDDRLNEKADVLDVMVVGVMEMFFSNYRKKENIDVGMEELLADVTKLYERDIDFKKEVENMQKNNLKTLDVFLIIRNLISPYININRVSVLKGDEYE